MLCVIPLRALDRYEGQKSLSFVKFKVIPSILCYLLGSLTNKYSWTDSSLVNFVDRFQHLSKESSPNSYHQGEGVMFT